MRHGKRVGVIIPALNEEAAIGRVVSDIPSWVDDIVVVDNGSIDKTAAAAKAAGARVVSEPRRGYGAACQTGIAALNTIDIVVFIDGDYSDYPSEMMCLVDPIASAAADLVIGSRTAGGAVPGALTLQQRIGNRIACTFMRVLFDARYTDLGPFRAIDRKALDSLRMKDLAFGWTVEMQIRALKAGLNVVECPVSYRPRIGQSKISGTVSGSLRAGSTIMRVILQSAFQRT
jgi:glycosyltransferase involved in cell wall biosynthesis